MPTVSVIYFTGAGHTAKLAEAVNKGAASVTGVKTNLVAISGVLGKRIARLCSRISKGQPEEMETDKIAFSMGQELETA